MYFRFLTEISSIGWLDGIRAFLLLWSWLAINAAYAYTPQSACCPYQLTHHPAWLKAAAPLFGEDSKMLPHWWVPEMRTIVIVVFVFVVVQRRMRQWLNNRTEFRLALGGGGEIGISEQAICITQCQATGVAVKPAVQDTDDGVWSESESWLIVWTLSFVWD